MQSKSLSLWIDGASRGNPGPSAIGVVVEDEEGRTLAEIGEAVGTRTNNEAEYLAILRGLRECLRLGADAVRVLSDSELLVRQFNGRYRVKSPTLKPLYEQALDLFRAFRHATVEHVMREENRRADRLAARALASAAQAPEGLVDLGREGRGEQ